MILFSFFISPVFATEINNPATCDSGTLSTDTGPTNLRANYESNTLNLTWYDDNSVMDVTSCTYGNPINLPTPPTKKGYTFKGWKVIKYTPIEYIQSTGTQYIDTGIVLQNATFDMEVMLNTITEPNAIIGYNYECQVGRCRMSLGFSTSSNGKMVFGYGDGRGSGVGYEYVSTGVQAGVRTHINAVFNSSSAILSINGVVKSRVNNRVCNSPITIYIAGTNQNDHNDPMYGRVYYVKIYDGNNVLVGDFIPVKDSNGVACMYDKVTGNFFYNAGTGNFIAGPDL